MTLVLIKPGGIPFKFNPKTWLPSSYVVLPNCKGVSIEFELCKRSTCRTLPDEAYEIRFYVSLTGDKIIRRIRSYDKFCELR